MKAKVDPNTCIGCGICELMCPSVFVMNDDGLAEVTDVEIDDSNNYDVNHAKEQCPVEAITTE